MMLFRAIIFDALGGFCSVMVSFPSPIYVIFINYGNTVLPDQMQICLAKKKTYLYNLH